MSERTKSDKPAVMDYFQERIYNRYPGVRGNVQIVIEDDLVNIYFIGVDLVQYGIVVDFKKLNDKHKYMKCVEKRYQMKYDELVYKFYRTNDENTVLDIIENALVLASAPTVHDNEGFVMLMMKRKSAYSKYLAKKRVFGDTHSFSKARTVHIYARKDPGEDVLDFADSIALDIQLVSDVPVNIDHSPYYRTDNFVADDETDLLLELSECANVLGCKASNIINQLQMTRFNTTPAGRCQPYYDDY
jgi:hypothetical protein